MKKSKVTTSLILYLLSVLPLLASNTDYVPDDTASISRISGFAYDIIDGIFGSVEFFFEKSITVSLLIV